MRARFVISAALVLALAVGGVVAWRWTHRSAEFAAAVGLAPAGTERIGWTDWEAVRDEVDAGSEGASDVDALMASAYDHDLSSASALGTSAVALDEKLGVSPANLDWEVFAQSPDGAALILAVPDSVSFDDLGDRLESLGFARPEDEDGTWTGGVDVVARIGSLTPQLQYWNLLEDERLVVTSDTAGYAAVATEAVVGDGDRVDGLDDVVDPSGDPVSAVVLGGSYTCEKLAMAQADGADQDQGRELVAAAGAVSPLTGFALSAQRDGRVRAVLSFESDAQARDNADSRAALAGGPAPGQGGDFGERFSVLTTTAQDRSVVLELEPVDGQDVVSDLSSGPVLFATC